MAQASLSVRIDKSDKKNFELFCNETGMNISVAINMFIKNVLKEHKLPFEISANHFYSKNNMEYLNNVISKVENGSANIVEHDLIEEE